MISKVKIRIGGGLDKLQSYLKNHPILGALSLIVAYVLFDNELFLSSGQYEPEEYIIIFTIIVTLIGYYSVYLRNKVKEEPKGKRIEYGYFIILILITLIIYLGYETLLESYTPSITYTYTKSETVTLLIIAPILKELAYRFLLYDSWARKKYGKVNGSLLVGLIYIITHPINSMVGFTVYWLPTVFLFLVYNMGGIKASIAIHMLVNLVGIL